MSLSEMSPWLILLLIGFLPTEIWRFLGVFVSGNVKEGSEVFIWVKAVATATLAGVVAKLALFPAGALANLPLYLRICALGFGVLAFHLSNKRVYIGVITAEAILLFSVWLV